MYLSNSPNTTVHIPFTLVNKILQRWTLNHVIEKNLRILISQISKFRWQNGYKSYLKRSMLHENKQNVNTVYGLGLAFIL